MKLTPLLAALSVIAALLCPAGARAGEGHDHGDAAPAPAGTAWPRLAAVSEAFELVGVLQGRQLTLYLDRADHNTPVTDARIELEIGGDTLTAEPHEDTYRVTLNTEPAPGVLPVTATVTVGPEMDLLAGELDVHEAAHADAAPPQAGWRTVAGWATAALLTLAALVAALTTVRGRRRATARPQGEGASA